MSRRKTISIIEEFDREGWGEATLKRSYSLDAKVPEWLHEERDIPQQTHEDTAARIPIVLHLLDKFFRSEKIRIAFRLHMQGIPNAEIQAQVGYKRKDTVAGKMYRVRRTLKNLVKKYHITTLEQAEAIPAPQVKLFCKKGHKKTSLKSGDLTCRICKKEYDHARLKRLNS